MMDNILNINLATMLDYTQWNRAVWLLALGIFLILVAGLVLTLIRVCISRETTPVKVFLKRIVRQLSWLGFGLIAISLLQSQELRLLGSQFWFIAWLTVFAIVVGYDVWYTFAQLPSYVARYNERDLKEKFLPKKGKKR